MHIKNFGKLFSSKLFYAKFFHMKYAVFLVKVNLLSCCHLPLHEDNGETRVHLFMISLTLLNSTCTHDVTNRRRILTQAKHVPSMGKWHWSLLKGIVMKLVPGRPFMTEHLFSARELQGLLSHSFHYRQQG